MILKRIFQSERHAVSAFISLCCKLKKYFAKGFEYSLMYILPSPDRLYIKWRYKKLCGRTLDLRNPQRLTEKIQWLKLYDRRPEYTALVDKYEVKKVVAGLVGEEHIIQTLGVWDRFDDIDFAKLPDQFVLKCTHDSGSVVVCTDKSKFDFKQARKKLRQFLATPAYRRGREWAYKNVKPRIIAEPYIDSLGKADSVEYKASCFNGKVGFITICKGIAHASLEDRTNDHFDPDFNYVPFWAKYKHAKVRPEKPKEWDELIALSEKLSAGIPYVRVDFYIIDRRVYFGEMTFYTWNGFMQFEPDEYDRILGDMVTLPTKKRRGK